MDSRNIQRLYVLALFALSLVVVGAVHATDGSPAATDRFAGMPDPEAYEMPAGTPAADTFDAAAPSVGSPTVRLRAGTYTLHRFGSRGALLGTRKVRLATARVYYTKANESTFSGARYVKLTSGPYSGWWVPAKASQPVSVASLSSTVTVRLAKGTVLGKRFFGPATTRRPVTFYAPTTYAASERAKFGTTTYYRIDSGPLANRWVSAAKLTLVSSSNLGAATPAPTSTPAPSTTPAPTAPPVAALTTWKTIVLLYRETDVTFRRSDGTNYRLKARMSDAMYDLVRKTLGQTVKSVSGWSGGMAAMDMKIVDMPHPLTRIDSLSSGKYWVGPSAVNADMNTYAPAGSYDSIIVVYQPKDASGVEIPVGGWGLTIPDGSWSNGAGFSSVITPAALWWWTDSPAPEEVFVHEWMHQVLFFHEHEGRIKFDLHAGSQFGYKDSGGSWKTWLMDVMQGRVKSGDKLLGMSAEVWAAGRPTSR